MDKKQIYTDEQMQKIKTEFSRLGDICYLDHAGTTLYSEKQLEFVFKDLSTNVYANPHALNTTSKITTDEVDLIRYRVLDFFNAKPEEYSVIFTLSTSHGLKTVAETFRFDGGILAYLEDNHTSVLGMRNLAPQWQEVKLDKAFEVLNHSNNSLSTNEEEEESSGNCLFVYPAQSNFAGNKYPLSWIDHIQNGRLRNLNIAAKKYYVLLDAASYVSSNQLDLSKYQPDFVTISFYKIFGYPSGLGALLVRRCSEYTLKKQYFGGGTILMALSSEDVTIPRPNIHERYEDGTISFLSILSLKHGFDTFKRLNLTPQLISLHIYNLAKYTYESLRELHHFNGESVAVLYPENGFKCAEDHGGIVNFNLKRSDGSFVGYSEVMQIANLYKICLRTGCCCNPGACQKYLRLSNKDIRHHFDAGHVCGDSLDLVDGYPTGSVRISFGYMSTYEECEMFLRMIKECFVKHPIIKKSFQIDKIVKNKSEGTQDKNLKENETRLPRPTPIPTNIKHFNESKYILPNKKITGELLNIYIYPVKSCAAFEIKGKWKLTSIGLEYDRRWMIVKSSGASVSQKQIKALCTLKPILDFDANVLRLQINDSEISVPINSSSLSSDGFFCDSKICNDKVRCYDCGDKIAEWLSENLERPGLRLFKQCDFDENNLGRSNKKGEKSMLSLANTAEYLLINVASVQWLREKIPKQEGLHSESLKSSLQRFRANFIVDFKTPFVETELDLCIINDVAFKLKGNCTRCQMICINQETGEISKEPLQTLSKEFNGKIRFGIYLSQLTPSEGLVIMSGTTIKAYLKDS
ncbi:molybdenum cofactor sulfurase 3 [Anthonomus grandis grandis]|uniref:molybdenum cofactor sulfurase 3 n=1 Tax=Anthonomus grandis grandis TaxID=2921223 RepID=UPI002165F575|nr:molybdenum cofactor sulfurase 3 [Anthonomus grandis grandis]